MKCFECDAPAKEQHHVIPRSAGGTRTVPLCASCHCKVHGINGKRRDLHSDLTRIGYLKKVRFDFGCFCIEYLLGELPEFKYQWDRHMNNKYPRSSSRCRKLVYTKERCFKFHKNLHHLDIDDLLAMYNGDEYGDHNILQHFKAALDYAGWKYTDN